MDDFKEVYLPQTAPRTSHGSEQGPTMSHDAVCWGEGGKLQISYKSFTASNLFLKEKDVFYINHRYFCCSKTLT